MEVIVNFLLQSGLCLLLLYLFYLLVLRSFPRPAFNRLYLLVAPVAAFIIPLLELPLPFRQELTFAPTLLTLPLAEVTVSAKQPTAGTELNFLSLGVILAVLYTLGGVALLGRLGLQLIRLRKLINSATPVNNYTSEATVLQTENMISTFAYLNYIFVSPQPHLTEKEQQQVLAHELAHVRLGHTYDVLYYEVLSAILWFNPLVWLLKAELRDVHEYQADAAVISTYKPQEYTSLLAKEALYNTGLLLGSHFYKPQVFKRLRMLQQHGQQTSLLRPLLVLPLLLALLFVFSSGNVASDMATSLSEQAAMDPVQATPENEKLPIVPYKKDEPASASPSTADRQPEAPATSITSAEKKPRENVGTATSETEVILPVSDPEVQVQKPYAYVEQMPHFKGGEGEMVKFLGENIRYPEPTREAGIEGLVVGTFVVETDGTLTGVSIIKSLQEAADQEALRVIEAMSGKWEPGQQDGKVVRVRYTLPIRFQMK